MAGKSELGSWGEAIAARYLERLGYEVRERNFRCPLGELDLVATEGAYIVFVEVKTRSEGQSVHPALSVTARKRAKVRQLGEYYCAHHVELPLQPRFDVIAVVAGPSGERVEHIVNAF
ncbi:MAG: YraN family protein [SAR324 cluster bacterium]|nr:YraN family protein [SAR324 cluster bacterium]